MCPYLYIHRMLVSYHFISFIFSFSSAKMYQFTSSDIKNEVCVHGMWRHSAEDVVSELKRGGEVAKASQLRLVDDGGMFKVFDQADKLVSRYISHAYTKKKDLVPYSKTIFECVNDYLLLTKHKMIYL